jgi:hypothetical protein
MLPEKQIRKGKKKRSATQQKRRRERGRGGEL